MKDNRTKEYPRDIKPLIISKEERIFYDENCLLEAGYEKKGTIEKYIDTLEEPDPRLIMYADKFPVWGKGDTLIVLTDYGNGTFGFGGWLLSVE